MAVQLIGAIVAAVLYYLIYGKTIAPAPTPGFHILKPVLIEAVFTFALAMVVLHSATSQKTAGNSFYGLAIGFTILAAATAGGPISGGAFNPAVGSGSILVDTIIGHHDSIKNIWIYLVGPFTGGAIAGLVFKFVNPDDK